jgi:hypothetical protein
MESVLDAVRKKNINTLTLKQLKVVGHDLIDEISLRGKVSKDFVYNATAIVLKLPDSAVHFSNIRKKADAIKLIKLLDEIVLLYDSKTTSK